VWLVGVFVSHPPAPKNAEKWFRTHSFVICTFPVALLQFYLMRMRIRIRLYFDAAPDADTDPNFYLMRMRIRIRLYFDAAPDADTDTLGPHHGISKLVPTVIVV
jgi:hypothetical protein